MREQIDNILKSLRNNETTFYKLILEEQTEERLEHVLHAVREYFSKEVIESLRVTESTTENNGSVKKVLEFECEKNHYLGDIFSAFFVNVSLEKIMCLLTFLRDSDEELSKDLVVTLMATIKSDGKSINDGEIKNHFQYQVLGNQNYTKETLLYFEPEQDQEAVLKNGFSFAFNFEYKPSYMLFEDEAKYLSWIFSAIIANIANELIDYIPCSHSILNISFRETEVGSNRDYLSYDANIKAVLGALYSTVEHGTPAYLICSDYGHWATVALVPIDGELHILKFDSKGVDNSYFADDFIASLHSFIESANLFKKVHECKDTSLTVQYDNNCGVASAAFISVLTSLLNSRTLKPIDDIINEFRTRYKMLALDPDNLKETTEKLVRDSMYYGLGILSECKGKGDPLFNYKREGWLDLNGQRSRLCSFINFVSEYSFSSCASQDKTQNSIFYTAYTVLSSPVSMLINVCNWVVFNIYCAISEKPLRDEAIRFCNKYNAWAQEKNNGKSAEKLFSEDLLTAITQGQGI